MAERPTHRRHVHAFGGAISGLTSCVLLQPLDLVCFALDPTNPALLRNFTLWSTAWDVIRRDSVWGLWRGTWPTILRNVPGSGMYFATLKEIQLLLGGLRNATGDRLLSDGTVNLIGGAAARVTVGLIVMPITVIKVRYESNLYNYTSTWQATQSILKNEGVAGLFRGFGATALRDAPHAGVYVLFYENCKKLAAGLLGSQSTQLTPMIHMGSGLVSGVAATVITNPFDVIKTRMQLKPTDYPSTLHSISKITKEEGFRGFFSGIMPRLLRKTFSSAITWTIYEEIISRRWF
ncbi:mitochondrial carrier domain-containing protein [Gaertneriomyces semiglobifer]|nr:mitochondrial carrier domain-containing protein [Gaertneriomyces semiglobifer]